MITFYGWSSKFNGQIVNNAMNRLTEEVHKAVRSHEKHAAQVKETLSEEKSCNRVGGGTEYTGRAQGNSKCRVLEAEVGSPHSRK